MSVYVDPINNYGGSSTFKWNKSCHMYADTISELHVMAVKIGLKLCWFQDKSLKHYDLTESKRKLALQHGAIETEHKHMLGFIERKAC